MGNRVYAGRSTRSRREPIVYCCPCGERFRAEVQRAVDSSDAAALGRLLDGQLNRVTCPSCEAQSDVQVTVLFHDLVRPRLVLVLPDGMRHRELEERAALYTALAADAEPAPDYVLDAPVVFGAAGLRAILAPPPSPFDDSLVRALPTETPAVPVERPRSDGEVTRPRVDPREVKRQPARGGAAPTAPTAEIHSEPTRILQAPQPPEDEEEHHETRVRMNVPDPRSAMIERWIAGREGPSAFLVEEQVLLCASLPQPALEQYVAASPSSLELRVQLHRMPAYPVLAVTVIAPPRDERQKSGEERVLTVVLDVARAAHRVVLDALGRRSALTVELYDSQYLPVVSHALAAPLEDNVKRLAAEAREALERLAPSLRSFERARGQLFQPSYDRLGRTQVELPDEKLESLEKPAAVLSALAQVARWSEPNAESYLIEVRSIPLARWRALRSRVILRALDVGIAVSRPLVERSAKEHPSPLPSWQELLAIQVRRFAEVSTRARANDLSAAEEAENWDLLLRECALAGVVVDDHVRQVAEQAVKRARASSGAGVDLRSLGANELVQLLDAGPDGARKELRRQAALILCERHEAPTLAPLFTALRRMTRGEANVILPAVTQFGAAAEKWLIEGLKAKKAYMRQGCALALGRLRTPLGVDALAKQLLVEPTEIWTEVARALGDVGAQAVMPVAAQLRSSAVGAEQRDRVVMALAHVAAHGTRQPIDMLAAGRDALVAAVARRALELAAEVRTADEVVRNGRGAWGAEQTVVRGFSRRFYEALEAGSGAIELDPSDLEELATGGRRDSDTEDDFDINTATDIAGLGASPTQTLSEDNTSPVPRIDPVSDSSEPTKSTLPGAGS